MTLGRGLRLGGNFNRPLEGGPGGEGEEVEEGQGGGGADYDIHISYFGSTTVTIPLGKRCRRSWLQHGREMKMKIA